jgi:hypothetical protein
LKNIQRRWVSPVRITVTSAVTPAEAEVTVMRMGRPMFVEPERRLDRVGVVLELELEKPLRRRFHSKRVSDNAIEQTAERVQRKPGFRVSQGRNRQLKCSAFDVFCSAEQKTPRLSSATG